ncbi:Uncharacterized protein SCF082_LOCUS21686 [Durusdinium trenchii]|uniref:Uncharacterized protein n=1 Tax=Durusdinium trenchii TaxID=1381693 RepID=A0ABP0LB07_9DINO
MGIKRFYLLLLIGALGYDTSVRNLKFTDIASSEYDLEGIVEWDPPIDVSQVLDYGVWMVPGQAWWKGVKLGYNGTEDAAVPIGTNEMLISPNISRDLGNGNYGEWLMVLSHRADEQIWEMFAKAAFVAIYDKSSRTVGDITVTNVQFADEDYTEGEIGGAVSWERRDGEDYGFVSEFQIFLADDDQGSNERLLVTVEATSSSYTIPNGTLANETFVLVYAANPNGRSNSSSSVGDAVGSRRDASGPV